jgi:hypothetical protein
MEYNRGEKMLSFLMSGLIANPAGRLVKLRFQLYSTNCHSLRTFSVFTGNCPVVSAESNFIVLT